MDSMTILQTLISVVPVQGVIYVAALCGVCAALMPWLPVPAHAGSAYGRVYGVLNLLAQNFRNVANRTKPGSTPGKDGGGGPAIVLLLGLGMATGLGACTMGGGSVGIDTAELAADAGAIDFAAQAIEAIPGLSSHLSAAQVAQVNAALDGIRTVTAQIDAASGGAIDIATGKGWASSLATEFQTVLTIAGTVASALDPAVAGYIATAEQIVPLIEAAVGLAPAGVSMAAAGDAPAVRAALYRGV
ncbi:hypothetical protein [Gluconacetobacter takamatsuzukensis]|uniref:Uncharacterized protein n=1 Tax=Gluconacetobacter takamatsuzukensis TaxID=1286190 RepID=A0A7W4KEU6_9PROT|nr:hypothetical protein [Gluconacetobacter takamatsuzukensis]MBB2205633.1 hypothetical protein [Gluconacetobacter takamatsuzukensis]